MELLLSLGLSESDGSLDLWGDLDNDDETNLRIVMRSGIPGDVTVSDLPMHGVHALREALRSFISQKDCWGDEWSKPGSVSLPPATLPFVDRE